MPLAAGRFGGPSVVCPGSPALRDEVGRAREYGTWRGWGCIETPAQPHPVPHAARGSSRYVYDFCRSSRWHGAKRKCDCPLRAWLELRGVGGKRTLVSGTAQTADPKAMGCPTPSCPQKRAEASTGAALALASSLYCSLDSPLFSQTGST